MKIFFFGPKTDIKNYSNAYDQIIEQLTKAGLKIFSKTESDYVTPISEERMAEIQAAGESVLLHVDGIVIEATAPDPEIGYLLAHAILQKKPTLCLYQKGAQIKKTLSHLGQKIPAFIMVKPYEKSNLEGVIAEYVKLFGIDPEYSDVPNIKFTLRISQKISHYLHWKTHNTKNTKADFLRGMIQDIIDSDEKYKKYIVQKKNK
ncbi:hypothetical protein KKB10_06030 [Patescibacteria group bacterium]|nr:hypothetical protein [Patescibacteria group bacterium]MBU1075280.1 hypothetical protein [Patescibacteria group bacterium]MBU1951781.1 hypothetical protein [Patescibacteria group bacterium]